jgi:hypothetical protein
MCMLICISNETNIAAKASLWVTSRDAGTFIALPFSSCFRAWSLSPPNLCHQFFLRWLMLPHCQHACTYKPVLWHTVCGYRSQAGGLTATFTASSFRAWLTAMLSTLLLPIRMCASFLGTLTP